jgi:hypothetical protein
MKQHNRHTDSLIIPIFLFTSSSLQQFFIFLFFTQNRVGKIEMETGYYNFMGSTVPAELSVAASRFERPFRKKACQNFTQKQSQLPNREGFKPASTCRDAERL